MSLAQLLRGCVLREASVLNVARQADVPQPTLQEFVAGRSDGTFADIRLSSAQKLIDYFEIQVSVKREGSTKRGRSQMRLKSMLEAFGVKLPEEEFKSILINRLLEWCPGRTIDDVLCHPQQSLDFCRRVRDSIVEEPLWDVVVLRTLLNIRKSKNCPRGLKKKQEKRYLKPALKQVGCRVGDDRFRELVDDTLADMYKDRTIDELLCYPIEASALCNVVRSKARCQALPDDLILSTLLNNRKSINAQ